MNNQEINFNNLMKRANAFMDRYINENNNDNNDNLKNLYKRVNGFVEGMTMGSSCNHECNNFCSNENCNNTCKNENNITKPVTAIDYANKFFEENKINFRFELHKNIPMIINGKVYSDCRIKECRKIENDDVRITVVATVANWHSETFVLNLSTLRLFYNKIKTDSPMMARSFNYSWIPLEILTNPLKVVDRTETSNGDIERPKTIVKKKHPHASYRMHSNAKKETPSNEGETNSNTIQKEPLPKTRETHVNMSDLTNNSGRYPWGEKNSTLFEENYKNLERNISHAFSNRYGKNVSNNEDEINKINMRILKDRKTDDHDSLIYITHRENATPRTTRLSLFAKGENFCYNKKYEDFFKAVYSSLNLPEDIKRIIIKLLNSHFNVYGNLNEFYFDLPQANKIFKVEFKGDNVIEPLFEVLNEIYGSKVSNLIGNFYKFYKIDLKNKEIVLIHNKIEGLKLTIGIDDLEKEAVTFTEVKENK